MDTGSVRAWPRMTRAQLKQVFPDGRTLHLPVDGKPLSSQGRAYAEAEWKKCKMVPCNGVITPAPDAGIMLASLDPTSRAVSTINIVPPTPMAYRGFPTGELTLDPSNNPFTAPANPFSNPSAPLATALPMPKAPAMMVATRDVLPGDGQPALDAIAAVGMPMPRVLMTPRSTDVLTAYAPEAGVGAEAQRQLDELIQRETTLPLTLAVSAAAPTDIRTAALGKLDAIQSIFDNTFSAVTEASGNSAIARTLVSTAPQRDSLVGLKPRDFDLVAPEIDHVNETLVEPVLMTTVHFAELYEPEGYLDNAAELGALAGRVTLEPDDRAPPRYDIFVQRRPLLVASR
jgi:hypothetical protein